ncbi:hypothetical protein Tco_1059020 [Tanacetum coccineum]
MAQLKYCDKHNQVGFLRKPDESAGFAEIVDFLRGSNLRYALTSNPTIYDSLVKQFWQTATANTKADGSLEINATIDTIGYTITEASIRDSLQLEDATGITMLPNDELFEGMGQMGYPTDGTFTFWKSFFTPQWRYLVQYSPPSFCTDNLLKWVDGIHFVSNIATAFEFQESEEAEEQPKLSPVASLKPKSIDKGRRYKRRKETKGKKVVTSLDFFKKKLDAGAKGVNTLKELYMQELNLVLLVNKLVLAVSIPSPDKGQRAGKAPMIIEEAPKRFKGSKFYRKER